MSKDTYVFIPYLDPTSDAENRIGIKRVLLENLTDSQKAMIKSLENVNAMRGSDKDKHSYDKAVKDYLALVKRELNATNQ